MEQGKEDQVQNNDNKEQINTSGLAKASSDSVTSERGENFNPEREQPQHQASLARLRATLLLGIFWMIIWGIGGGLILYAIGILPTPVLRFATGIAAVTAVIGVIIGQFIDNTAIRNFFRHIWQNANRTFSALGGLLAVVVILGGSYLLTIWIPGPSPFPPTPTPGLGVTPIHTPPPNWASILKQLAPNCNNPQGVEWHIYSGGTRYICYTSGGAMQQTTDKVYAEMDLTKVKGGSYNLTHFRLQADAAFQSPDDTTTWAALLVQTPTVLGAPGGYIFAVSPDGHCVLQYVETDQSILIEARGSANFDPRRLVRMMVIVQDGVLYAYVNGQQVLTYPDNISSAQSNVSLMVERQNAGPSSLVEFSNFELDTAN